MLHRWYYRRAVVGFTIFVLCIMYLFRSEDDDDRDDILIMVVALISFFSVGLFAGLPTCWCIRYRQEAIDNARNSVNE